MTRQDGEETDDEEAPVFFKTDAERAAKQATKARHDAGEAGSSVATGARNLGAAALAGLAEVTAPQDDKKGRRHARKSRAKALKLAEKNRQAAAKAADKARGHGAKAAGLGRKELDRRSEKAGGKLAAYAGTAGTFTSGASHRAAEAVKEHGGHAADVLREQGGHAAEVLRERSSGATQAVAGKAGPVAHSAAEGVGHAAGASAALIAALAAAAREKASETRARAVTGLDRGVNTAVPRAQEGVAAVGPRVDQTRDVINDELLPKLQAMLGDVQAGKDKALARQDGAVAGLTAAPKKRKRKGGVLITLGLLAAAGAGVAYWLAQQSKAPATDPWAQPATVGADTDPWASTAPTSQVPGAPGADMPGTGVSATAPLADAHLTDEELSAAGTTTGASTTGTSADGEVHMLATDEIDEMGSDKGIDLDAQGEGQTPTEEIEAAQAKSDEPLTVDRSRDGEDPDTPRA